MQTLLAQINRRAIYLVEQDGGYRARDLHGKGRALYDVYRGDERFDKERAFGGIVNGDGVCFALYTNGGIFAAGDENGVI
jgi:hypothetical protein